MESHNGDLFGSVAKRSYMAEPKLNVDAPPFYVSVLYVIAGTKEVLT